MHEDEHLDASYEERYEISNYGYPDDWPRCPGCGAPALDGHITCGRAACDEAEWRATQIY